MNIFRTTVTMIFILFFSSVFAGTIRHDVPDSQYTEFGKKFYCVKQLVTTTKLEGSTEYGLASCVILNKHWIITAGHIPHGRRVDNIKVMHNGKAHLINKFIVHKDFDEKGRESDIALGFCKKGFGDDVMKPKIYQKKINIGDKCSAAGFGYYGTMNNGAGIMDNKLRGGSNIISERRNDAVLINGSKDSTQTTLEWLPNVGDSGGGLFVDGSLAGITSYVIGMDGKANSTYGDKGAFTEIYPYLQWINSYVKKESM